ncbi:MAG: hypothetical protein VX681_14045 [Myxococcota bacterium]|nr:hypothetical protein [Myxococcota bacterium]
MSSRPAALTLAVVLGAQLLIGAHYVSRTAIFDGDARVFVLWDDAMISMRYARNLALGHGLVWNPGETPVQGFSNLGVTLVMAALHALGLPRVFAALGVQLLALGALVGTAGLCARNVQDVSRNAWAGVGAALALLLCAPHQIYALQGSDTSFVALLLAASHAQLIRGWLRKRRWPISAFVPLLVAVVVRPDASLFVVTALAVVLLFPDARGRTVVALPVAGFVAVWAGLIAFSLAYYGDPLPNTYYLKASGTPRLAMWASGFNQLGLVAPGLLPAVALGGLALLARPSVQPDAGPPTRPLLLLLAGSVAAATAYHVWVGGDWIREYGSRHLVQILPSALSLAAIGAARIAASLGGRAAAGLALLLAAAPGAAANPLHPAREWFQPKTPTLFHRENQMNFMRSRFLERTTRSDTSIAVHWGGVGPYFADRTSLDILGRSDRHIAHTRAEQFVPGHSKWDWDYVLEIQQPDLIDFESRNLRDHPRFRSDYLVLRGGPTANLFVRRDAVDKLLDPSLQVLPLDALFGPAKGSPDPPQATPGTKRNH